MKLLIPSDYQPMAQAVFESLAEQLHRMIPEARIEHIGASSIPGAVSKGDLDICLVVAAHKHPTIVQTLEAAGYVVKADTLRTPELCMLLSPRNDLDVALQIIAEGSTFESFMHFRDALRADPRLVERYNEIKHQFASLGEDCYRDAKDKFIESVLSSL